MKKLFTLLITASIGAAIADQPIANNNMCLYVAQDSDLVLNSFEVELFQSADGSYRTTTNTVLESQSVYANDSIVPITIAGLQLDVAANTGVANANVVNGLVGAGYTPSYAGFEPGGLNFYISGTLNVNIGAESYACSDIAFAQGDFQNDASRHNWYALSKTSGIYPMVANGIGSGNAEVSNVNISAVCHNVNESTDIEYIYILPTTYNNGNSDIPYDVATNINCNGWFYRTNWFSIQLNNPIND
jgi:hypothetical protein